MRIPFTPTHASWMNLVEVWFGIVERQAIRRGVFKSVKDLNTKIRAFVDGVFQAPEFIASLERFVDPLVLPGRINSLAQTLIKIVAPGVPDFYQGTELWDLSLVDPDNRRRLRDAGVVVWLQASTPVLASRVGDGASRVRNRAGFT